MVRSMVVILAFVGVVLLFAPQPGPVEQPEVSDVQAVVAVQAAATELAADPILLLTGTADAPTVDAADLPDVAAVVSVGPGWRLDYARTESIDDVTTWRQGLLSPGERRVDLEQAVDPTDEWLTRADEGRVTPPEPVQVAGQSWSRQVRGDGDTAYTFVDTGGDDPQLTTTLSATSDSEDLRTVVELVSAALTG